jgi:hypothetical protein
MCESCAASREPPLCVPCKARQVSTSPLVSEVGYSFGAAFRWGAKLFFARLWIIAALCALFAVPEALIDEALESAGGGLRASRWASNIYSSTLGLLGTVAAIATMAACAEGRSMGFGRALREGLNGWWRVFAARFYAGIRIIMWGLLLIVPGVVKSVQLALVTPAAYLEPGRDSHQRSTSLTDGQRWSIFGLMMASTGGVLVLVMIVGALTGILSEVVPSVSLPSSFVANWISDSLLVFPEAVMLAAFFQLRHDNESPPAVYTPQDAASGSEGPTARPEER